MPAELLVGPSEIGDLSLTPSLWTDRSGIISLQMENDSQLVEWRHACCCPLVIPRALSPTSWGMRPSFMTPFSCPIRGQREPISREVMPGSSGGAFSGFCNSRATHASITGHDYRPNGRKACWESTVAAQKAHNPHLRDCDESKFVKLRRERDRSLPMPTLILSASQVNLAGGRLPKPQDDGRRYLKIPLNAFPQAPWAGLEADCD
jgi:hypothetical protein